MLMEQFQVKGMGPAKKCLGIHIELSNSGFYLYQTTNIDNLLIKRGMENCRPVSMPVEATRNLRIAGSEPFFETVIMRERTSDHCYG